jgi:hypothetical protein
MFDALLEFVGRTKTYPNNGTMLFVGVKDVAMAHILACLSAHVATLLWPSVGVKPNTWKKLGLELSQP